MSNLRQDITPILQPQGTHQCWAAVVAMILGRTGDSRTVIHGVISEARAAGVPTSSGDALDVAGGPPALAGAFGLHYIDLSQSLVQPGSYYASFLQNAPFGLFGVRPGYGPHAVAINRLHGDFTSPGSTTACGIDPASGQFSRSLIQLVTPQAIPGGVLICHGALWR